MMLIVPICQLAWWGQGYETQKIERKRSVTSSRPDACFLPGIECRYAADVYVISSIPSDSSLTSNVFFQLHAVLGGQGKCDPTDNPDICLYRKQTTITSIRIAGDHAIAKHLTHLNPAQRGTALQLSYIRVDIEAEAPFQNEQASAPHQQMNTYMQCFSFQITKQCVYGKQTKTGVPHVCICVGYATRIVQQSFTSPHDSHLHGLVFQLRALE